MQQQQEERMVVLLRIERMLVGLETRRYEDTVMQDPQQQQRHSRSEARL